jgi:hypothetical protein
VTGDFSSCSASCGDGTKTRDVQCQCGGLDAADSACIAKGIGAKPVTQAPCNNQCTCGWETCPWGACNSECGPGTQTRNVICKCDDIESPVGFCTGSKPITQQACDPVPTSGCSCTWKYTQGTCSTLCGPGTKPLTPTACTSDPSGIICAESQCGDPLPSIPCNEGVCPAVIGCTAKNTNCEDGADPSSPGAEAIVEFTDNGGGSVKITITVTNYCADVRGVFFDFPAGFPGAGSLGSCTFLPEPPVTDVELTTNNLGNGANIQGCHNDKFQLGVEIGTAGASPDEYNPAVFNMNCPGHPLAPSDFKGTIVGVRATSVRQCGSNKDDSDKMQCTVPTTPSRRLLRI